MTAFDYLLNNLPDEPENYFRGLCSALPALPQEILFFMRRNPENLLPGEPVIHQRFNLIVNLGGPGRISLDFHEVDFRPGQALLIFPCQLHIYEPVRTVSWGYTGFDLAETSGLEPLRYRPVEMAGRAMETYRFALEQYRLRSRAVRDPDLPGIYLAAVLRELVQKVPEAEKLSSLPERERMGDKKSFIRLVRSLILQGGWTLSVPELAEQLKLSESALHKKFRRILNRTPGHFIADMRLEYACRLLKESCLTVGQISLACEYRSPGSFIRAFEGRYGETPGRYRRNSGGISSSGGDS